jgi:hypothetical protein
MPETGRDCGEKVGRVQHATPNRINQQISEEIESINKRLPTEKFFYDGAVHDAKPFHALKPRQTGAAAGRSKVVSSRMSIVQPFLFLECAVQAGAFGQVHLCPSFCSRLCSPNIKTHVVLDNVSGQRIAVRPYRIAGHPRRSRCV